MEIPVCEHFAAQEEGCGGGRVTHRRDPSQTPARERTVGLQTNTSFHSCLGVPDRPRSDTGSGFGTASREGAEPPHTASPRLGWQLKPILSSSALSPFLKLRLFSFSA